MRKILVLSLYTIPIIGVLIFIIISIDDINSLVGSVSFVWLFNILFAISKIKKRQTFLIFNLTFFVFLMGKIFFVWISGKEVLSGYSVQTKYCVFVGLIAALISLTIGQLLGEKWIVRKCERRIEIDFFYQERKNKKISQIVLFLFYFTYPFYLLYIIDKASYVGNTSYLDLYTSYISNVPYLLIKIGELNQILFILLFCTEHNRKKLLFPFILFLITSALTLLTGQRNIFVLNLVVCFLLSQLNNSYCVKNSMRPLFSSKKTRIVIACAIPLLIILMEFISYARMSSSITSGGLWNIITKFFLSQGSQIEFFANTFEYKDQIWAQTVPYTFSSVYNYFRNLFGIIDFGIYTKENAFYGNSLGATQFYISSPGSLLSGKGAGCCYLSELFFDFGFIGIVIGCFLLGIIISKLKAMVNNSFWKNTFIILMIRYIVYIPRASCLDWLSYPFNIWNVFIVICISFVAKNMTRNALHD